MLRGIGFGAATRGRFLRARILGVLLAIATSAVGSGEATDDQGRPKDSLDEVTRRLLAPEARDRVSERLLVQRLAERRNGPGLKGRGNRATATSQGKSSRPRLLTTLPTASALTEQLNATVYLLSAGSVRLPAGGGIHRFLLGASAPDESNLLSVTLANADLLELRPTTSLRDVDGVTARSSAGRSMLWTPSRHDGYLLTVRAADQGGNVTFGPATGLSGTVTSAGLGNPLFEGEVRLWSADGTFVDFSVPLADGSYAFIDIEPGQYRVTSFGFDGFVNEAFDDIACSPTCDGTTGDLVEVTAGAIQAGIDFALDGVSGTINGTVTRAGDGSQVEGALLQLYSTSGELVRQGATDASGGYSLSGLPDGEYVVLASAADLQTELYDDIPCNGGLDIGCTAAAGTPLVIHDSNELSGVDFELAASPSISGNLSDGGLELIEGAAVWAYTTDGLAAAVAFTDAQGDYTLSELAAGDYYILADAPEYREELFDDVMCSGGLPTGCSLGDGTPVSATVGAPTAGIDFELVRLGSISGTVTASLDDAPLEGIVVEAFDDAGVLRRSALTASDGSYELVGLDGGSYFVSTESPEPFFDELYDDRPCPESTCLPTAGDGVAVSLGKTTAGIDFALSQKGRIEGVLLDATSGAPVATFAYVSIYSSLGGVLESDVIDSADGSYVLSNLEAGNYFLVARAYGYVDQLYEGIACTPTCEPTTGTQVVVSNDTTSVVDFALIADPGVGSITGRAVDQRDGQGERSVVVRVYDSELDQIAEAYTNQQGSYEAGGLQPGIYYVVARDFEFVDELFDDVQCSEDVGGPGCPISTATPVVVAPGGITSSIDFLLTAKPRIDASVENVSGARIAGARVRVYRNGVLVASSHSLPHSLIVEGPGDYEILAAAGNHVTELYDDIQCESSSIEYCPSPGDPVSVDFNEIADVEFQLDRFAEIDVTVLDQDGEPTSVLTQLWDLDGESSLPLPPFVDPGTYFLTATAYDHWPTIYGGPTCLTQNFGPGCDPTDGLPIEVDLNETASIILTMDDWPSLSGSITDALGSAIDREYFYLGFWTAGGVLQQSRGVFVQGTEYELTRLDPGLYLVTADADNYYPEVFNGIDCNSDDLVECGLLDGSLVELAVSSTTENVDFSLPRQGSISGRVTNQGDGILYANVRVYDVAGSSKGEVRTDEDGFYVLGGLEAGTYFARADRFFDYVPQQFDGVDCFDPCENTAGTPIVVAHGQDTPMIDFDLASPTGIKGTVNFAVPASSTFFVVEIWSPTGALIEEDIDLDSYEFSLSPGSYHVTVETDGFPSIAYPAVECDGTFPENCSGIIGDLITVTRGEMFQADFLMARPASLETSVSSRDDGEPLAGANVVVWSADGADVLWTGQTGVDGLALVELREGFVRVEVSAPGFTSHLYGFGDCHTPCDPVVGSLVPLNTGPPFPAGITLLREGQIFVDGFESQSLEAWEPE